MCLQFSCSFGAVLFKYKQNCNKTATKCKTRWKQACRRPHNYVQHLVLQLACGSYVNSSGSARLPPEVLWIAKGKRHAVSRSHVNNNGSVLLHAEIIYVCSFVAVLLQFCCSFVAVLLQFCCSFQQNCNKTAFFTFIVFAVLLQFCRKCNKTATKLQQNCNKTATKVQFFKCGFP